jgi:nucleoid DNA-binding protein
MTELKTKVNKASVDKFIKSVKDERVREDCYKILEIMKKATKSEPKMWGTSIVGFGSYHYKSKSGREGDWMLTGFSPRKQNLTLYIMTGLDEHGDLLENLGKHTTGKSCLYVKKLDDVDLKVLKKLVAQSVRKMKELNK